MVLARVDETSDNVLLVQLDSVAILHLQHCMWYYVHVHHKATCAGFVPQKCADELCHMLAEVAHATAFGTVSCCGEI